MGKQYCSAIKIDVELDTSDAQKVLDELDDKIRNNDAFKAMKDGWQLEKNGTMIINNGQVFIKDAFIDPEIKTSLKLSPEMEKAISDAVSAELKKNLKPGGTIWDCLRRGI